MISFPFKPRQRRPKILTHALKSFSHIPQDLLRKDAPSVLRNEDQVNMESKDTLSTLS